MSGAQVYMLPTLNAEWEEYRSRMCHGKTDYQIEEMRVTFYGGMYVMYMKLFGSHDDIPEEVMMQSAEAWREELDVFMAQVQRDLGIHHDGRTH